MTHLDELISLVRHPAIQERRGKWPWRVGDCFWTEDILYYGGPGTFFVTYNVEPPDDAIWIPKLSDPVYPERGLISMIGGFYDLHFAYRSGKWVCTAWEGEMCSGERLLNSYTGHTPEIAVAKAVIAQSEEIKQ